MIENNEDEDKMNKLETLFNYIVNNKEGIVLYKLRPDVKLPEAPEGVKYRNLGTMEHNICNILAQRMKGNKTSWTKTGASNLAKIITEKVSKELNKSSKNGNFYCYKSSSMLFSNCSITNGRKAIQNL